MLASGAERIRPPTPTQHTLPVVQTTPQPADIPLPESWQKHVEPSLVHAVALARLLFARALGERAAPRKGSCCGCSCGGCRCARLESELALVQAERDVLYGRLAKIPANRRPYYEPHARLRILELMAARGWSFAQTAARLLVARQTISAWFHLCQSGGKSTLVRTLEPVNRFPDAVTHMVRCLKASFPDMGKERIANLLIRAGIAISTSTVGRMIRRPAVTPPEDEPDERSDSTNAPGASRMEGAVESASGESSRAISEIRSRGPGHTWNVDITVVPTLAGFWLPWIPFSVPPSWPFCWHVAAVMDHFSRRILAFDVFPSSPAAEQMGALLDRAAVAAGKPPRYTITDKGGQFWCAAGRESHAFTRWCRRHGVRPRFGAVGEKGSIARLERFWRSFKDEWTRRIIIPFGIDAMYSDVGAYIRWYNSWRPHSSLGAATPNEVFYGNPAPQDISRIEVRSRYPLPDARASPTTVERASGVRLQVSYLDGRAPLPCIQVQIDRAA